MNAFDDPIQDLCDMVDHLSAERDATLARAEKAEATAAANQEAADLLKWANEACFGNVRGTDWAVWTIEAPAEGSYSLLDALRAEKAKEASDGTAA